MFWRTIGRLILVPLAFLLSILLAAFVAATLGLERFTGATGGKWGDVETIDAAFNVLLHGEILLSGLTLLPSLALVIIGEVARIRSALYYIVGGGLALAATPLLAGYATSGSTAMPATVVWQVLATAGFAGGALYWLLAGRRA